ncbi:hypothetical protein L226DRAFT_545424 [Lentinus tigrinus ALCF2SS1-7]|uniref:uncharacterized protein n=1 Tax=Lentinus tigrinus ALCF2SS1-7 TaxID=1328758 RepID=UPI00116627DB|nr:hypothetical protein L226DRAFT_545424 [Lentinus tigrinus ALCF2SS1-7]
MPVTFNVASQEPSAFKFGRQPLVPHDVLKLACEGQAKRCRELLQCSLNSDNVKDLAPRSNGFVHAVLEAYGSHHHLRIRPDDVWVAILTQLSFYVNKHSEDLRAYFVAHQGKKRLTVNTVGDRYSVDYAGISRQFASLIHKNVVDSTLVEWILPDFTTTTWHDRTIGSMVMMSTLKAYFEYFISIECGIPSVTLEGEKSDWEEIYRRLYRLYELGDETSIWADMLRPILRRFVDAFDGKPDVKFWEHIVHRTSVSCGEPAISGWITAFCLWSHEGNWSLWDKPTRIPTQPQEPEDAEGAASKANRLKRMGKRLSGTVPRLFRKIGDRRAAKESSVEEEKGVSAEQTSAPAVDEPPRSVVERGKYPCRGGNLEVDGVEYFPIATGSIPAGYSEVDVTVDDNGNLIECMMVAGHVAIAVTSKEPGGQLDTLSPSAQWFMFEKR